MPKFEEMPVARLYIYFLSGEADGNARAGLTHTGT